MALTQPTSVRLRSDLRALINAEARRTGESKQQVICSAIRAGLSMFAQRAKKEAK